MNKDYISKLSKEDLLILIKDDIDEDVSNEEIIHLILNKNVSNKDDKIKEESFGIKAADKLAKFAGSRTFIIVFTVSLFLWIIINLKMNDNAFDPYPFILLNLVLSCIAAVQAPLIMMSQNRQEAKDRIRSENDYIVNLKTEIIIHDLHDKLDKIIENQREYLSKEEETKKNI